MANIVIVGSTGLVGSHILTTTLTHPSFATISALTRRPLPATLAPTPKLNPLENPDTTTWSSTLTSLRPSPSVLISGLGTTRAAAGGFAAQRKIDYDLNLELAQAAAKAGVKHYVLISSANASSTSWFGYPKMKGELEDAVSALGFEKVVIVRPGLIVGSREDSRPPEYAFRVLAGAMGKVSGGALKDFWAQDAEVIGRAAVSAAVKCLEGTAPEGKVWSIGQSEIVKLGRTEWKGE